MICSDSEIKATVKKVWEKVLSKKDISEQTVFSDVGGDPSLLVEIVFLLEQELRMDLPVEVLFMMSTIEEMAFAIKTIGSNTLLKSDYLSAQQIIKLQMCTASLGTLVKPDTLMIKVNEAGELPPLFWCFNSPGQEITALSKRLSKNQPLYALTSSVTLGRAPEILKNLASHYVDEIIRLYPDGPYHLGGNCRGARVMCEIMFQLEQRGKHIEKLCLLESFNPRLFEYTGKLVLLFGETSKLQRHKLLNWGEAGWQDKFTKVPDVYFIPCAHGQFLDKNIKILAKRVNDFLGRKSFFKSLFSN